MKNTILNPSANSLNIRLSDHFTLSEMTFSGVALRYELKNIPTDVELENLRHLCELVLEPLRRRYGRIIILSGYRSPVVNALVGGVPNSQHQRGEAADIFVGSLEKGRKYVDFNIRNTDFDQLTREPLIPGGIPCPCWLHTSHTGCRRNRHSVL